MFITFNNLEDKTPKRLKYDMEQIYIDEGEVSYLEKYEDSILTEDGRTLKDVFNLNEEDARISALETKEKQKIYPLIRNDISKELDVIAKKTEYENEAEGEYKYSDLVNRNNANKAVGYIYIEPWYYIEANKFDIKNLVIPFEFNPIINESSAKANYEASQFLNRVNQIRTYVGGEPSGLTIEATYMALSDGNVSANSSLHEQWQTYYTPERLKRIELMYRSLIMPYYDGAKVIKPMIVQVFRASAGNYFNNSIDETITNIDNNKLKASIGDFYSYPSSVENGGILSVTKNYYENAANVQKRYIVLDVTISELDSDFYLIPSTYDNNDNVGWKKMGFKVSLTLAEANTSFLDVLPTFKEYYEAWTGSIVENSTQNPSTDINTEGSIQTPSTGVNTEGEGGGSGGGGSPSEETTNEYLIQTNKTEQLLDKVKNPTKYVSGIYSSIVNDNIAKYLDDDLDDEIHNLTRHGQGLSLDTSGVNKQIDDMIKWLSNIRELEDSIRDFESKIAEEETNKDTNFIRTKGIFNGVKTSVNSSLNFLLTGFASFNSKTGSNKTLKPYVYEVTECIDEFRALFAMFDKKDPNDSNDFSKWTNSVNDKYDEIFKKITTLWGVIEVDEKSLSINNIKKDVDDFKKLTNVAIDGLNSCLELADISNYKIIGYKSAITGLKVAVGTQVPFVWWNVAQYNMKLNKLISEDKKGNNFLPLTVSFKKIWEIYGNTYDYELLLTKKADTNITLEEAEDLRSTFGNISGNVQEYIEHYQNLYEDALGKYNKEIEEIQNSAAGELSETTKMIKTVLRSSDGTKKYDPKTRTNGEVVKINKNLAFIGKNTGKNGDEIKDFDASTKNKLNKIIESANNSITITDFIIYDYSTNAEENKIEVCELCAYDEKSNGSELGKKYKSLKDLKNNYDNWKSKYDSENNSDIKRRISEQLNSIKANMNSVRKSILKINEQIITKVKEIETSLQLSELFYANDDYDETKVGVEAIKDLARNGEQPGQVNEIQL